MADTFFSKWHGLERSGINWHPAIDPAKCTGCGLCVVTCGEKRNVFGFDKGANKAVVLYPDHCMVGCLWNAIRFSDEHIVRELAKTITPEQLKKELDTKLAANPELRIDE